MNKAQYTIGWEDCGTFDVEMTSFTDADTKNRIADFVEESEEGQEFTLFQLVPVKKFVVDYVEKVVRVRKEVKKEVEVDRDG